MHEKNIKRFYTLEIIICIPLCMAKVKDLKGQKFGKLTVLEFAGKEGARTLWKCECLCGNEIIAQSRMLQAGQKQSCGCLRKELFMNDLTGQTFGKLTVLKENTPANKGRTRWDCQCACGNVVNILGNSLSSGLRSSCGCEQYRKRERHQCWNHNLTQEERELSQNRWRLPETREWKQKVMERDNYTCPLSGKRGNFNVHHIESWKSNKELRFDVNNGITLWEPLHRLFHKLYGRKNNNRFQFDEFCKRYKNNEFTKMIQEMEQPPLALELT
jgi:hypothetical protein